MLIIQRNNKRKSLTYYLFTNGERGISGLEGERGGKGESKQQRQLEEVKEKQNTIKLQEQKRNLTQ